MRRFASTRRREGKQPAGPLLDAVRQLEDRLVADGGRVGVQAVRARHSACVLHARLALSPLLQLLQRVSDALEGWVDGFLVVGPRVEHPPSVDLRLESAWTGLGEHSLSMGVGCQAWGSSSPAPSLSLAGHEASARNGEVGDGRGRGLSGQWREGGVAMRRETHKLTMTM